MAKDLFLIPLGGSGGGGERGIQGVQGATGAQGTAGTNGVDGFQGIQGIKGADGANGVDGSQGIQGIKGTDGTNGAQGIQGIAGENGTNGLQGIQGTIGIQGPAGGGSGGGVETVELTELTESELGELYEIVVNEDPVSTADYLAEHRLVANGMPVVSWNTTQYTIDSENNTLIADEEGEIGAAFFAETKIEKEVETPDTITTYWYCIFKQEEGGNYTYVLEEGTNTYENSGGGGGTRYDILTKSQSELADFYQNWERVMASNDVYVGVYPVTAVIPEYTVQGYTALLLEYNVSFALEADATTQTPVVKGDVGAYYILPNGMGGTYGSDVTMPSKGYVDAVVAGIQAIQGIQGTAGTNGVDGLQGIQGIMGIQGASGGGASKIELTTLPVQDLLQFYQATLAGTMKDFSQYTAVGYPLINAYQMNAGWVVDTSYYTGTEGTTYTTDGTEVAIVMNQTVEAVGTRGNETQRRIRTFITLFSPTIYQTYGQTIDTSITVGYSNVAQLQFVLADDSIVNYTMPLSQW